MREPEPSASGRASWRRREGRRLVPAHTSRPSECQQAGCRRSATAKKRRNSASPSRLVWQNNRRVRYPAGASPTTSAEGNRYCRERIAVSSDSDAELTKARAAAAMSRAYWRAWARRRRLMMQAGQPRSESHARIHGTREYVDGEPGAHGESVKRADLRVPQGRDRAHLRAIDVGGELRRFQQRRNHQRRVAAGGYTRQHRRLCHPFQAGDRKEIRDREQLFPDRCYSILRVAL